MNSSDCFHAVFCGLLVAFVFLPTLRYPLLYDDVAAIENNADVRGRLSLVSVFSNDFWGTPIRSEFSHKSYRPLSVLSFWRDGNVARQRFVNVLLHVVNSLLFGRFVKRLTTSSPVARTATLLFCLHPIHVETIVQLVGRAELLCALFYLLCLLTPSYGKACVFTTIAMLCKEQGITSLAVKFAVDALIHAGGRRDRRLRTNFLLTAATVTSLLVGRLAIGGAPAFHLFDNPAAHLPSPLRQINLAYLAVYNMGLLINPHKLSCDYTFKSVPLIETIWDSRLALLAALFAVAVCGALAALPVFTDRDTTSDSLTTSNNNNNDISKQNNNRIIDNSEEKDFQKILQPTTVLGLSGLVMTAAPWLPASNLFFYVGFVVAERVLYLPVMGVSILVALGYQNLVNSGSRRASFLRRALVVLLCCWVAKSALRSREWRNGLTLYGSAVRAFPENIKMWTNLGKARELDGDFHLALGCYDKSLSIHNDLRASSHKAKLLARLNKSDLASDIYQTEFGAVMDRIRKRGRGLRKDDVLFVVDFVKLLVKGDELDKARRIVDELSSLVPSVSEVLIAAGEVHYYSNEKEVSEKLYRRAIQIDPRSAENYYNLGVILMERGSTDQAAEMFHKCIERNPHHEPSKVNLNVLSTNLKDSQMMDLYGDAMDALRAGSYFAAESLLHQVLSRQPYHTSALYNLALLQTQIGTRSPSSSLAYLDRLLSIRPSHAKGLLLKANIFNKQLNDPENSVELYAQAYQFDHKLESALQALCDLSPKRAFSMGGSCDRDVELEPPEFTSRQSRPVPGHT